MRRLSSFLIHPSPFAWIAVGCFLAANTALSYFPLSLEVRLWVGVLGLILPAILAVRMNSTKTSLKDLLQGDVFSILPAWGWLVLALSVIALRFYQITSLSFWPLEDEAMNGHYAIELAERGSWQLTYDFSGMPPLYVWGLGLFFKYFGISLLTLWFFPSLLSVLAAGFAFAGARLWFSKSIAFLLTGFWALSFWPLYVGRFSLQGGFLIFWMALTFYFLAVFVRAKDAPSKRRSSWVLGLCAGAGFYTFTSWAIVAFALTLFVFQRIVLGKGRDWKRFLFFFLPEVALFLILAWATFAERGGHFRYVLQNPFGQGWPGLNDVCAIFWGSRLTPNLFAYRPFWGGFLNPVLGALCFWGAVVLSRAGISFGRQGLFFLLLILPGFLTGGLDGHRVVQSAPFLLWAAVLGLASLLSLLPRAKRWWFAGAVLLLSAGLDAHHLFGVYHSLWAQPKDNWFASKSVERLRAFTILRKLSGDQGPGFVLSDLVPDIFDQSLSVAAYSFDASQNEKIGKARCRWAALLINVHFQPYLAEQFPEARWFWLASDAVPPHGGLMLGLIPLPASRPEVLNRYIQANQACHAMAGLVYDNHDWKGSKPILRSLERAYPLFKNDPFLESCFWEKTAEYQYRERDIKAQIAATQRAVVRGIRAAHFYNNLGALYLRQGVLGKARESFEKALHCEPNHTSAAAGLAALDALEKTGVKPKD